MSRAENKVVILDEVWSLIGAGSNAQAAEFVLELFKTVRGYGASAIAASQDLEDFFALENGKSRQGTAQQQPHQVCADDRTRGGCAHSAALPPDRTKKCRCTPISHADRFMLCAGRNRLGVQIIASPREHELITTDPRDIARIRQRQHIEETRRRRHPTKEKVTNDE
ncbi:MAG: hypothetical protein ACLR4Z_00425 [Butyricicoccaceae bacterium]